MSIPTIFHPETIDFLRHKTGESLKKQVWSCLEKLRQQQFDNGLQVKKLKGLTKRIWEARVNRECRLIFTYEKSRKPETGLPQTYLAVQDICLDHDDVSRRARARTSNYNLQCFDNEIIETVGNIDCEHYAFDPTEKTTLETILAEDLKNVELKDELLTNIQWRVLESKIEWQKAIVQQDSDLPLKLTPEEYELVRLPGNLLLSGSAGTGKTTVAIYKLIQSLENLVEHNLYITKSPLLANNAREQFNRLAGTNLTKVKSFKFKTLRNLCLEVTTVFGTNYIPENEVNFQVFSELYQRHPKHKQYPTELVWDEIHSIIKGGQLAFDVELLSKKDYESLGKKRSTVIPPDRRHEIYALAQWYQKKLKQSERYDEIDLARKVLQIIPQNLVERYELIVCDEVQDFTELQLELLFQLLAPNGKLFFAGDLNQTINPSGFRWEELKQKFYRRRCEVVQKTLNFNFRSVSTLVNLSHQILQLHSRLLKTPVDSKSENKIVYNKSARIIATTSETLKLTLGQLNPSDAILVRTNIDKTNFSTAFQSTLVFTIEEAKGLEFDTVFLVEFFQPHKEIWHKVIRRSELSAKEKPHLTLELNLLYVAITRARRVLNIIEAIPSQIWDQPELSGNTIELKVELIKSEQIEATPEEWHERGMYYLQIDFCRQAIECFEKAGDLRLQRQATAKLLIQQGNYLEAAEIWVELQEWQKAAPLFEKVRQWKKASECWLKASNYEAQTICEIYSLETNHEWALSAQKWESIDRKDDAKRCWLNIPEKKIEYQANELKSKKQWLKAAQLYERLGKWEEVAECKLKVTDDRPPAPPYLTQSQIELQIHQARMCYLQRKPQKAELIFTKAITLAPDSPILYHYRGILRHELKNSSGAEADYNQAITLNLGSADVYNHRGKLRQELKNYLGAQADYDRAIALNPQFADAYNSRAIIHYQLKNYLEAETDYDRAIALNPQFANAYNNRGILRHKLENYLGAEADYDRAITLNPQFADAYNNRGILRHKLENYLGAEADYDRAITLNPQFADAYNNRGILRHKLENYLGAEADYDRAIVLNPQSSAYDNLQKMHQQLAYEPTETDTRQANALT